MVSLKCGSMAVLQGALSQAGFELSKEAEIEPPEFPSSPACRHRYTAG